MPLEPDRALITDKWRHEPLCIPLPDKQNGEHHTGRRAGLIKAIPLGPEEKLGSEAAAVVMLENGDGTVRHVAQRIHF